MPQGQAGTSGCANSTAMRADAHAAAHRVLDSLSAQRGPLHLSQACAKMLAGMQAEVAAADGECPTVVMRSADPLSCFCWRPARGSDTDRKR